MLLRRLATTALASVLLGGGLVALAAAPASAATEWRVWSDCTQDGTVKARWDHDYNQNGRERLRAQFYTYTATGWQTWDWKTKVNGQASGQGASTTDASGDLRSGVNLLASAPGQALNLTSLAFDATNRTTGERCRLTVAVPPIDQPLKVDLEPNYAQGFCSEGSPWRLTVNRHLRTTGHEKFTATLRIVAGPGGGWSVKGFVDGSISTTGSYGTGYPGSVYTTGVSVIGELGVPLDIHDSRLTGTNELTGESCDVSLNILPLA